MIWPLKRVSEFCRLPTCHGMVYYDWLRRELVTAPIPLNLVLALFRHIGIFLHNVHVPKRMLVRDAFYQGFTAGLQPHHPRTEKACVGMLVRLASFWIGWHWSPMNRRLCINLIPCVTIWIVRAGGVKP